MTDAEFDRLIDATVNALIAHDEQSSARSDYKADGTSRPNWPRQSSHPSRATTDTLVELTGRLAAHLAVTSLDVSRQIQARRFAGADVYHAVTETVAHYQEANA